MIGHALLMFTPEEEDRVLTGKLHKGMNLYHDEDGIGCLFQVATGLSLPGASHTLWARDVQHTVGAEGRPSHRPGIYPSQHYSVAHRYDDLCWRFGVERIANAIRSRILTNQLRRQLAGQAVAV